MYNFLSASSPAHVPELYHVIGGSACDAFLRLFSEDDGGEGGGGMYAPGEEAGSHEHDGVSHYTQLVRVRFNGEGGSERDALRDVYSALMTASCELVEKNVNALVERLRSSSSSSSSSSSGGAWSALILDLHAQYGCDIGIFSAFFFNVLSLQRGDAIFLAPCLPHAYIR